MNERQRELLKELIRKEVKERQNTYDEFTKKGIKYFDSRDLMNYLTDTMLLNELINKLELN